MFSKIQSFMRKTVVFLRRVVQIIRQVAVALDEFDRQFQFAKGQFNNAFAA